MMAPRTETRRVTTRAAVFPRWEEARWVNARDVKHLPGRPKTGKLDAVWLCKVAEQQMLRPGFVPPPRIRRLRDMSRYRADLVRGCIAEKLPEDAKIKLSVVATDIFGVSGRDTPARGFADKAHRLSAHGPGCDFAGVLR
jgi:hypothetical protein